MASTMSTPAGSRRDAATAGAEHVDGGISMDVPTMIAVSTVAWAPAGVLHEIVGHGGAAVLLGVPVRAVSTTTILAEWDEVQSMAEVQIIHASATLVNLLTACLALAVLRSPRVTSPVFRYFLWVFAIISFVVVTLNLLVGGDWSVVIEGMEPAGVWQAGVLVAGIVVGVLGYVLPLRLWLPDLRQHRWLQLKVTAVPVLVLLIVQTMSVLVSLFSEVPMDTGANALITSAALAVFFGLWLALVNRVPMPRSNAPVDSIALACSKAWLAVGLVAAVLFIGVLGPGPGPLEADPRLALG